VRYVEQQLHMQEMTPSAALKIYNGWGIGVRTVCAAASVDVLLSGGSNHMMVAEKGTVPSR
jgi:hypothetical protein